MKKALLFSVFLLVAFAATAQSKLLFDETLPESYLIKAGNSQASIHSIINLLQGNVQPDRGGRPNRKPEFVVKYEQQARVIDEGDNLRVSVVLDKINITGDVIYRGFHLGSALLPDQVKYSAKLLNSQNKEIATWSQTTAFHKDRLTLISATIPDTATVQRFMLKVEEKELIYSAESIVHLQQHLDLIQSYYAAEASINQALQQLYSISAEDVDRMTLHDRNLKQLEETFEGLKKASYREKLNLKQHDPQKLLAKMSELEQNLQAKRSAINHALATLDQQFYNKGIAYMNAGNASVAQAYFAKSIEVNPAFAPAHLQMARLDFINGYIKEAATRTLDIMTRMRIDPQTAQIGLALAQDIYGAYIVNGNNFTSRGDYQSALATFGQARNFCSAIGGLRCNLPALNEGEGRAAYGAYRAIVEDGRRFLSRNDLVNAERAASDAQTFQRDYKHVLADAREADELQNKVKQQYYLRHIDQGKVYLSARNYQEALYQFEAALDLEHTYAFQPVRELGPLAQQAAKPVLIEKLRQGYEQAMRNSLADARATASIALDMQNRFALEQDKEVVDRYKQLTERIQTQECINTQAAYDKHQENARELVKGKKYLAADQAYQAALKVAAGMPACNIATFTATDGRMAIAKAVSYQQMLENINHLVTKSRFTEAIAAYEEAEKYYLAEQVGKFGLNHISLFNFARDNQKQSFTAAVIGYYANRQQEKIAMQLLTSLLDKGYSKGKTKKVQQQLGKQLALKDASAGAAGTPKALSATYTNGNKKLKQLGKAYEKEKKRLAKG
ncbi:hypothetical protein [Pontibacter sp. SGAir0037]|uniref:hypothetical protein n=1 Tax=Pontibacter sp. SGAir0037 TaxID=2571030 RepID=UPI0010CD27AF|nr:hypothetical protein [Pontibacter sp. SGAir0037]QCR23427.1 hypothetical protein C1N53_14495 [Pontibacter sp. SGAir0037]